MEITLHGYDEMGEPVDVELFVDEDEGAALIVRSEESAQSIDGTVGPVFFSADELVSAAAAIKAAA